MLSTIIGKQLTDIYTVGFLYLEGEQSEFTPDLRWIYIEFEDILLEFASIEQYSRLRIEKVLEVQYHFECDEDMIKAKSSIIDFVLVSSMLAGNIVKDIELIDGTEKDCSAAKIILENGQMIFVDPSFTDVSLEPMVHFINGFLYNNLISNKADAVDRAFQDRFHDWVRTSNFRISF